MKKVLRNAITRAQYGMAHYCGHLHLQTINWFFNLHVICFNMLLNCEVIVNDIVAVAEVE